MSTSPPGTGLVGLGGNGGACGSLKTVAGGAPFLSWTCAKTPAPPGSTCLGPLLLGNIDEQLGWEDNAVLHGGIFCLSTISSTNSCSFFMGAPETLSMTVKYSIGTSPRQSNSTSFASVQ